MPALKLCVVCGEPSTTSRCNLHRPQQPNKTSRHDRGYTDAWARLSTRARRIQPWCTDCGTTHHLTVDHSPQAWDRHAAGQPIRLDDIDVVCTPCNNRRGAARGPNAVDRPTIGTARAALDPRG